MKTEKTKTGRKIVFRHNSKTGGSTLYGIIDRYYERGSIYNMGIDGSIDDFKNLSVSRRSEIRMLRGHHGFGLYKFLPGPSTHLTLLRDPVDRVISYYDFLRRRPQDRLHDLILSNDMSLKDFVESRIPVWWTMARQGCYLVRWSGHTR